MSNQNDDSVYGSQYNYGSDDQNVNQPQQGSDYYAPQAPQPPQPPAADVYGQPSHVPQGNYGQPQEPTYPQAISRDDVLARSALTSEMEEPISPPRGGRSRKLLMLVVLLLVLAAIGAVAMIFLGGDDSPLPVSTETPRIEEPVTPPSDGTIPPATPMDGAPMDATPMDGAPVDGAVPPAEGEATVPDASVPAAPVEEDAAARCGNHFDEQTRSQGRDPSQYTAQRDQYVASCVEFLKGQAK